MRDALNATGRPIVYSVHSSVTPGTMQPSLANFWRTGPDIGSSYEQVLDRAMIANNVSAYLPAGPGGWADPDMLVVRLTPLLLAPRSVSVIHRSNSVSTLAPRVWLTHSMRWRRSATLATAAAGRPRRCSPTRKAARRWRCGAC